jgi:regulatory protein
MSKLGFSKRDNDSRCKNSAIYSLAMREHSRYELTNKLLKKDFSEGVDLEKLLDGLEDSDYLSDRRFAESYIRSRVGQGKGRLRILNELKQRGVSTSIISNAMQESGVNWFDLVSCVREKKFGENIPVDYKEKTKQMRFLSGRGFDSEMIRYAVG